MQEGSKGRIEVREAASFELRFHVPVGVLKFSSENHVDSSTVQQTLAKTDSFIDSQYSVQEESSGGRCRTPRMRIVLRILNTVGALDTLFWKPQGSCNTEYQHRPCLLAVFCDWIGGGRARF
jgi:hypothetical protein